MSTFLHGRRRKLGLLTLVLACAFAAAWIRSSLAGDYLCLVCGKWKLSILSQQGTISTGVFSSSGSDPAEAPKSGWWTVELPTKKLMFVHYNYQLPYWAIDITLIGLSAWLMLSKPQSEPIAKLPKI